MKAKNQCNDFPTSSCNQSFPILFCIHGSNQEEYLWSQLVTNRPIFSDCQVQDVLHLMCHFLVNYSSIKSSPLNCDSKLRIKQFFTYLAISTEKVFSGKPTNDFLISSMCWQENWLPPFSPSSLLPWQVLKVQAGFCPSNKNLYPKNVKTFF